MVNNHRLLISANIINWPKQSFKLTGECFWPPFVAQALYLPDMSRRSINMEPIKASPGSYSGVVCISDGTFYFRGGEGREVGILSTQIFLQWHKASYELSLPSVQIFLCFVSLCTIFFFFHKNVSVFGGYLHNRLLPRNEMPLPNNGEFSPHDNVLLSSPVATHFVKFKDKWKW